MADRDRGFGLRFLRLVLGLAAVAMVGSSLLEASFVAFQLTIEIRGTGEGFVTVNGPDIICEFGPPCKFSIQSGTPANLEAHPLGDSVFVGWGGACSSRDGNRICRLTMNSDKSVTATFRRPRFLLSVTISGSGSGRVTTNPAGIDCRSQFGAITGTCTARFEELSQVTLSAQPGPLSNFLNWGNGDVCAGVTQRTCSFSMPGAGSTVAPIFRISIPNPIPLSVRIQGDGIGTVTSNPSNQGGIDCRTGRAEGCATFFSAQTPVTLTATPTGSSTFGGWGGDCATAGTAATCTLTMSGSKSVTATFTPPPSPTISPTAIVALNGTGFRTGQTISYQATLTPGSTPVQVDVYLGVLLPDGVTFLSLVPMSAGFISIALGPSPIPFMTNVTLTPAVVPFSHTFRGLEPVGSYFAYAGLVVAGTNPFQPANQLSLGVQGFQFNP